MSFRQVVRIVKFDDPKLGEDGYSVYTCPDDWPISGHYDLIWQGSERELGERLKKEMDHALARNLMYWGKAMKEFIYGCIDGAGNAGSHGAYVYRLYTDDKMLCAFCHNPVDEPPRRWSK